MTRKTKRQIEKELERLRDEAPTDISVTSSVRTITDGMTDESGNLIEDAAPDHEPPEGYEFGAELSVTSDAVTVRELEPVSE